jgi:hypothetical protein
MCTLNPKRLLASVLVDTHSSRASLCAGGADTPSSKRELIGAQSCA